MIRKVLNKLDFDSDYFYILKKYRGASLKQGDVRYKSKALMFKRNYYKTQILNLLCGYRSYLISILLFNNRFNITKKEYIDKYSEIIEI